MRTSRSRVIVVALVLVAVAALAPGVGQAVPDQLTEQLAQARDRLAELDTRVSVAVEDYNAAAARLDRLQAQQEQTTGRVEALTAEADRLEAITASYVRSMYIRGPAIDLRVALDSDGVAQVGRDLAVMDRLSRLRQAELERLGATRTELAAARDQLSRQVAAAADRERELDARRADVEAMVAEQRGEVVALQDRIAEIEAEEAAEAERRRQAAEREAAERAAAEAAAARDAAEQAASEAAAEQAAQQATAPDPTPVEAPPPAADPAPTPEPPPPPAPAPTGTRAGADTAVQAALSQVGKPYRYAAAGPDSYDCSGLTQWAWQHAGVSLPHSSRMQYAATTRITADQLQPGDLVFYGSPIHHVAMYLDGTRVVEAPYTGANVRVREDGLLRGDIAGFGRV